MQHDDGSKVLVGVHVSVDPDEIRQVGFFDFLKSKPEPVDKNFSALSDMILRYSKPIVTSLEQLCTEEVPLQKATAEFGLSFDLAGNIFLVEASAGASIKVSLEWSMQS